MAIAVKYGDKKIRPMVVLGPNLTFSTGQFPTLCEWIHIKIFLQLENHNVIQTSRSRSARNQSWFYCWWLHQPVWKWPAFLYGAPDKKVHGNQFLLLKQLFLPPFVIFGSFLTAIILSMDFLIHSKFFVDSYKDCGQGEGGEVGHFWCIMGIGRIFLS